jgi:dienelactone hydrolase
VYSFLIGTVLCSVPAVYPLSSQFFPSCSYRYSQEQFEVHGRDVLVEFYVPEGQGEFPLVFMIHGAAGAFSPKSSEEPATDNFGEKILAHNCFVAVLPHYLDAIGRKGMASRSDILAQSSQILDDLEFLLQQAENLPAVKSKSVFLFGESLGGYLSIKLAFKRKEVVAVSEFGGGLPPNLGTHPSYSFNVMISHGEDDTIVPTSEATALRDFCVDHQIPVDMKLYRGEGHYFSRPVQLQVAVRTVSFFRTFESRQPNVHN